MGFGQLIAGFIVAFTQGAELTGYLLAFFPLFLISAIIFFASIMGGIREMNKSYS